jgi:cytosine permease
MGLAAKAGADHSQHWGHLSSIQLAGGIISVPLIAVGAEILLSNGIADAILSIILGNLIIFGISLCIVLMSYHNHLNAIENAEQFVGKIGGRILAFFVLITMIGWLPRQLAPASQLLQIFPFFSSFNVGALLGALASLVLLFGIKGLKNLCFYSVIPLMLLFLAILFNVEITAVNRNITFPSRFDFSGTSLIVSSLIASIIDFPTFFRHSKSKKDSIIALIVILFGTIVIQCLGLLLYHLFLIDKNFIFDLMAKGEVASILISIFLVISIVTSASWNIYAASVGWESLFPKFKDKTEYAVIGLTATLIFTSVYMRSSLIPVTNVCDTFISGIGGVLVFEYLRMQFLHEKSLSSEVLYNNASWWIGGFVGLFIYFGALASYYSTFVSLVAGFGIILMIIKLRKIYSWFVGSK